MATLIKLAGKWQRSNKDKGVSKLAGNGSNATGNVIMFAGTADKIPSDWLLCDGTEYNVTDYPDLYDVIGNTYGGTAGSTFKVPDYRECTLVGVGQNTTNSMGAHNEYTIGQFKDDQLQRITGSVCLGSNQGIPEPMGVNSGVLYPASTVNSVVTGTTSRSYIGSRNCRLNFNSARQARSGTTTHGKQKGVNYIIHI